MSSDSSRDRRLQSFRKVPYEGLEQHTRRIYRQSQNLDTSAGQPCPVVLRGPVLRVLSHGTEIGDYSVVGLGLIHNGCLIIELPHFSHYSRFRLMCLRACAELAK